ncbi:BspA family leucine-rich repeat surface protein, partial [Enterococcus faecium]
GKVNHSAITLKNSTTKKHIGDLYGEAELRENIASLKNKEGEDSLTSDRSKVTITAIDQDGKSVALNDLTKKIGTYTITYSYNGVKATESLTVEFVGWQYDVSDHTIILRKYTGTSENVVIPASGDFGYPDYNVQIDFAGLQSAGENAHILRTSGNGVPIKVISSSLKEVFLNNENLQTVDLDNLDVSDVVNMHNLFRNCNKLSSLNIKDWDTQKVDTMCGMFYDCRSLTSLDVSRWDTRSAKDVNGMFSGCTNLQNLDISQWNTRKVNDMGGIFFNCKNL